MSLSVWSRGWRELTSCVDPNAISIYKRFRINGWSDEEDAVLKRIVESGPAQRWDTVTARMEEAGYLCSEYAYQSRYSGFGAWSSLLPLGPIDSLPPQRIAFQISAIGRPRKTRFSSSGRKRSFSTLALRLHSHRRSQSAGLLSSLCYFQCVHLSSLSLPR